MPSPIQILITISTIMFLCSNYSSPALSATSTTNIETGAYAFDTTPYYNNVVNANLNNQFNIVFLTAKANSLYQVGLSFQSLDLLFNGRQVQIQVYNYNPTTTEIVIIVQSNMADYLYALTIRYIVAMPVITYFTILNLTTPNNTMAWTLRNNPLYYLNLTYTIPTFNVTGTVQTFLAFSGFDVTTQNTQYKFDINPVITSITSTSITISTQTIINLDLNVDFLRYTVIIYNQQVVIAANAVITSGVTASYGSASIYSASNIYQTNTFVGICSYHFAGNSEILFSITVTNTTSIALSTPLTINYAKTCYIILQAKSCVSPDIYYNPTDTYCYNICPAMFYPDNTLMQCLPCLYDCSACTGGLICSSCSIATNRQKNLTTNRCDAIFGYYDDGTNSINAVACSLPCSSCITSASNCLSCSDSTMTYNSTSYTCNNNCSTISYCLTCTSVGLLTCTTCISGYIYDSSQNMCSPICGNGIITTPEQCDDSNSLSGDGCSNTCQIEPNFICNSAPSLCYLQQLSIAFQNLKKIADSNSIELAFAISPALDGSLLANINWAEIISIAGINMSNSKAYYDASSGCLMMDVAYTQNLNFQPNASVVMDFSKLTTNAALFSLIPKQSLSIPIISSNSLSLEYYPDSAYTLSQIISYVSLIVSVFSILMFLAGYVGGKLIAIQTISVVQVSYLMLLSLCTTSSNLSPGMGSLIKLRYSTGYNNIEGSNNLSDGVAPEQTILASTLLLQNYNIAWLVVMLPLVVALILKIATTCTSCVSQNKITLLRKIYRVAAAEYTLYGLLFSEYIVLVAFALNLKYYSFNTTTNHLVNIFGLLIGIICIVLLILYFILSGKSQYVKHFGEFKAKFYKYTIQQKYYNIVLIEKLLTSVLLLSLSFLSFIAFVMCLPFICLLVFNFYKKPYIVQSSDDNGKANRPKVNIIITMSILCLFGAYKLCDNTYQNVYTTYICPLSILALLVFVLVYNCYYLIREIKESCQKLSEFKEEYGKNQYVTFEQTQKMRFQELQNLIIPTHDKQLLKSIEEQVDNMTNMQMAQHWQDYQFVKKQSKQRIKEELKSQRIDEPKQRQDEQKHQEKQDQIKSMKAIGSKNGIMEEEQFQNKMDVRTKKVKADEMEENQTILSKVDIVLQFSNHQYQDI